jgi:pyruvate dehydrogenase E1 component
VEQGIVDGLYKWADGPDASGPRMAILFSGSTNLAARQAAADLAEHYDVSAELWSATSYKRLREDALSVTRWNLLHPTEEPRVPMVTRLLSGVGGPIVAVTDYMKLVPDQVQPWVPGPFTTLGTDGFGRSDARKALRRFFEVDAGHIVAASLATLAAEGKVEKTVVRDAHDRYQIDPEAPDPAVGPR